VVAKAIPGFNFRPLAKFVLIHWHRFHNTPLTDLKQKDPSEEKTVATMRQLYRDLD
jgi:hypothetical protein